MRGVVANVTLEVPGSSWSYPSSLDGIQSGDEVLVFAEFPDAWTWVGSAIIIASALYVTYRERAVQIATAQARAKG